MRGTIEFYAVGSSMNEVMLEATAKWKKLVGDDEAALPNDSEIHIKESKEDKLLTALVTVRTKIDN
jgi:hypothetical protein